MVVNARHKIPWGDKSIPYLVCDYVESNAWTDIIGSKNYIAAPRRLFKERNTALGLAVPLTFKLSNAWTAVKKAAAC